MDWYRADDKKRDAANDLWYILSKLKTKHQRDAEQHLELMRAGHEVSDESLTVFWTQCPFDRKVTDGGWRDIRVCAQYLINEETSDGCGIILNNMCTFARERLPSRYSDETILAWAREELGRRRAALSIAEVEVARQKAERALRHAQREKKAPSGISASSSGSSS